MTARPLPTSCTLVAAACADWQAGLEAAQLPGWRQMLNHAICRPVRASCRWRCCLRPCIGAACWCGQGAKLLGSQAYACIRRGCRMSGKAQVQIEQRTLVITSMCFRVAGPPSSPSFPPPPLSINRTHVHTCTHLHLKLNLLLDILQACDSQHIRPPCKPGSRSSHKPPAQLCMHALQDGSCMTSQSLSQEQQRWRPQATCGQQGVGTHVVQELH